MQAVHRAVVLSSRLLVFLLFFAYARVDRLYHRAELVLGVGRRFVLIDIIVYLVVFELLFELEILPRLFRLLGKRPEPRRIALHSIVYAIEIGARALVFALRLILFELVLAYARRFLEHRAAILGLGINKLRDTPLTDYRIALAREPGVTEHVRNITQSAKRAVYVIFALVGTEKLTSDNDFLEVV